MTNLPSYAPRLTTLPRARAAHSLTICLDQPLRRGVTAMPAALPTRRGLCAPTAPDAGVDNGILFGLAALIVPAVAYSLVQLCGLMGGSTLEHAIRAFLP